MHAGDVSIRLFDMAGKLICSGDLPSDTPIRYAIPVLASGMYILHLTQDDQEKISRIDVR